MSIRERLTEDMKEAMRARDKQRLSVIRMARAAIQNRDIEGGDEAGEEEVIEVLSREVKQRRESLEEYDKLGKNEEVERLQEEIAILKEYLPEQLTDEELEELIEETIEEVGADDIRDLGKVMGAIMPEVKGRAEGSLVNQKVRELLADR